MDRQTNLSQCNSQKPLFCGYNETVYRGGKLKYSLNPLPEDKILDWSKLKQIADNILRCISNE